jgi:hypothetical protein
MHDFTHQPGHRRGGWPPLYRAVADARPSAATTTLLVELFASERGARQAP